MTSTLDGARAKVERAKKHILDGSAVAQAFFDSNPYAMYFDHDANTDEQVCRIHVKAQPPAELSLIIGDAIHNLRAALDYLAVELVRLNGGAVGSHIYFPVCWDRKEYKAAFLRKVEGMPTGAITMLDSMQPYRVGQLYRRTPLYVLHDLDVRDKHHSLHVVGGAITGSHIEIGKFGDDHYWKLDTQGSPPTAWISPVEEGTELFRVSGEYWRKVARLHLPQADVHGQTEFAVVVQQVRPGEDEAVVPLFVQLTQFVEGTLNSFGELFFG